MPLSLLPPLLLLPHRCSTFRRSHALAPPPPPPPCVSNRHARPPIPPTPIAAAVMIVDGKGQYLFDETGRRYLDVGAAPPRPAPFRLAVLPRCRCRPRTPPCPACLPPLRNHPPAPWIPSSFPP